MGQDGTKQTPDSRDLTNLSAGDSHYLVLYNDDVHTFLYVIECLIRVCGHDAVQAEQCALITHHQGKCDVQKGERSILEPMLEELVKSGLKATID